MRLLIVYATTHGHTAKVAGRVAEVAHRRGASVDVVPLRADHEVTPVDYDAVIAAGSVHVSRHQGELVHWLRDHHTTLNMRPTALLSVSLSAADDSDEARADTRELIDRLLDDTGWIPTRTLAVAGALRYRHYDLPTRIVIGLIARQHGQSADPDAEIELTDWEALETFAQRFLDEASTPRSPRPLHGGIRMKAAVAEPVLDQLAGA